MSSARTSLADTAVSGATPFVDDQSDFGQWAGDLVAPFVNDRVLQDDDAALQRPTTVGGHRGGAHGGQGA